jgi:hypothetical protein
LSPGRRTNRKNFRTCQRTRLFLLLLFLESKEKIEFYLLKNQLGAACSQGYDDFWCSGRTRFFARTYYFAISSHFSRAVEFFRVHVAVFLDVEMWAEFSNHADS